MVDLRLSVAGARNCTDLFAVNKDCYVVAFYYVSDIVPLIVVEIIVYSPLVACKEHCTDTNLVLCKVDVGRLCSSTVNLNLNVGVNNLCAVTHNSDFCLEVVCGRCCCNVPELAACCPCEVYRCSFFNSKVTCRRNTHSYAGKKHAECEN